MEPGIRAARPAKSPGGKGQSTTGPAVAAGLSSGSPAHMLPRERWAILLRAVAGAGFLPGALDRFVFPKLALAAAGVGLAMSVPARGVLPRLATWLLLLAGLVLLAAGLAG